MATIQDVNNGDTGAQARAKLNGNDAALNADISTRLPNSDFVEPKLPRASKTFNRNPDGSLASISDDYGTKTFVRDVDGVLLQIVGTGSYQTKTFNRNPDGSLASITVS